EEVDPIRVRVEHVEQAQLVVELHDGADVDVHAAQALGLGLQVLNVDGGDAAFLRLAFGERDLHGTALELGPAAVGVEVRLCEAELRGVEAARVVEIAHPVPDSRRHGNRRYSARPGISKKPLSVRRNRAPSAPSTARWSHVSVMLIIGSVTTSHPPSTTTA